MFALGVDYLEVSVLGKIPQARPGRLLVMIEAKEIQFEQWLGRLQYLSLDQQHVEEIGTASALKLELNKLTAGLISSLELSLGLISIKRSTLNKFVAILR